MIDVEITTVDHTRQRFNIVGDYVEEDSGKTKLTISKFQDTRMEMITAVGELVKIFLCKSENICAEEVEDFGYAFDDSRAHLDTTNPAEDVSAPNHKQHKIATRLLNVLCEELELDWNEYQKEMSELLRRRQLEA